MRNRSTQIMLGLGVFAVVAGGLLRFYAYDQLAIAPIDQSSEDVLVGEDATIFDTGSLSEIKVNLTTKAKTVGLVDETEKAGGDTLVWLTTTKTTSDDGVLRSGSVEKFAFDRSTGEAVDCCDTFIENETGDRVPVKSKGLLVKFPFETEKKTYDWWDSDLKEAVPIKYVKDEKIEGVSTYKFEQTIEPTVVDTQEVPASILGEDAEGNLEAEMTYSNVRTLWVEPRTGVVIKRTEQQHNTIRYNGEDRVVTTDVTTGFDDKTVKENADKYGGMSTLLFLLRTVAPIVLVLLGLVLIALAVMRNRKAGRHQQAA